MHISLVRFEHPIVVHDWYAQMNLYSESYACNFWKNRSWDASLKARVLVKKAEQVAGGFGEPFDVIFIDPPYAYETAECNQLLSDLAAGSATNENTVIMLERSVRSDDPTAPGGWQITESRNYGETAVFYIESADDDSDIERSDDSAA